MQMHKYKFETLLFMCQDIMFFKGEKKPRLSATDLFIFEYKQLLTGSLPSSGRTSTGQGTWLPPWWRCCRKLLVYKNKTNLRQTIWVFSPWNAPATGFPHVMFFSLGIQFTIHPSSQLQHPFCHSESRKSFKVGLVIFMWTKVILAHQTPASMLLPNISIDEREKKDYL